MKHFFVSIAQLLTFVAVSGSSLAGDDFQVLKGPYLGQTPPGLTPEVFAPNIISTKGWEVSGVFGPDMKEFYYIRENAETKKQELVLVEYKDNRWNEKAVSPRRGTPTFSPDGMTMHLGGRYKERSDGGWSEIKSLGSPFEEIEIMRLTSSSKGTYTFDEIGMPGGVGIIRYSQLVDGKREEPKSFGKEINTGTFNAHPYIAPDESYIIWDGRRESGYGGSDLYISFQQKDGSWSDAINMGDQINSEDWDAVATVTPDGKYLIFNRMVDRETENVDLFWVDAQIIETLRPK